MLIALCLVIILTGCAKNDAPREAEMNNKYGVFLGLSDEEIPDRASGYETVVIDGQDISKETVAALKDEGHTVYGYLSIGSLEKYRPYYPEFSDITLGKYENWPDEYWVDVSDKSWQTFVIKDLAGKMAGKGFDGFFLDNADICFYYPQESVYTGLVSILEGIDAYGLAIVINGGDSFVTRLIDENRQYLIDAVNQESVFSRIDDYENDVFGTRTPDYTEYFTEYLSRAGSAGLKVYLLEYTTDDELVKKIEKFCKEKGYGYYISEHVDLK